MDGWGLGGTGEEDRKEDRMPATQKEMQLICSEERQSVIREHSEFLLRTM